MKIYCLLIAAMAFASCKKTDDSLQIPKLTGWRIPDCGVTIGEGMYEAFNDSETKYLITAAYPGYEEQLDTSVVSHIGITSHTVITNGVNNAYFEYQAQQPLELHLSMLLNSNLQQLSLSGQIVDTVSTIKTRFNLANALAFGEKGCHRLYYVFSQKLSSSKSRIVNKGHFDIVLQ